MLLPLELLHLLLSEVHLISWVTLERNRIVGILGMSLMIDISAILPIRILCHIVTHFLCWCVTLWERSQFTLGRQYLEGCESRFVCCSKLHRVRVDDSGLLFKVESIFFSQKVSLRNLIHIFLLILRHCARGIWIAYEAIRTTCSTTQLSTTSGSCH